MAAESMRGETQDGEAGARLPPTRSDASDTRIVRKQFLWQAEETLRESEERFRVALKNLPVILYHCDGDLRYTWVYNLPSCFPPEQVLGKRPDEVLPAEDVSELLAFKRQVLETGRGGRRELAFTHRGATRHYDITAEPGTGPDGQATGLIVAALDITGRKQAEQALRDSEERLRAILTTAVDGIITIDERGLIESVNPAAERLFGYTAAELVGQGVQRLMPSPYREEHDTYLATYLRTGVRKIIGRGREVWGQRKDGTTFPMDLAVSEFHLGGRQFFTGVVRDSTERKRAEEAERAATAEARIVRQIQQQLFPAAPPRLAGVEIGAASYPVGAAGGDYFDYLHFPDGALGAVVGDAAGHGVGPALLMAAAGAYLRALAQTHTDVPWILTLANRILADEVGDRFITLLVVRLDPRTSTWTYTGAGHQGYLLNPSGKVDVLAGEGLPLGIAKDTTYAGGPLLPLEPGAILLLPSDGVKEASAPSGERFGTERALDLVRAHRHRPAQEIVEVLCGAVRDFCGGQPPLDDVTAVVVKVESAQGAQVAEANHQGE
jgi:PAS domain S-box-containing protein